jgi:vesicle-fusing ATPase
MLHCSSEPKIISGPEIFNKYVGESERKVRELFKDAEDNPNDFHVIIIDEIDAMCRKRGSGDDSGGSRVNDSIVNQLLAKIDGVNSIDNILLIGMTNRLDMMDKALLRPGRFEVQIEVGLPDKKGRKEILTIHTKTMTDGGVLDENVNIDKLATHTKNFTGAEIEGLVKSAVSFATQRHVDNDDMSKLHDIENIMVMESDFDSALGEVTPAFGLANEHELAVLLGNGVIDTWKAFQVFEEKLKASIFNRIQTTKSILLHGQRGCGKTALIARIGLEYNIPFVKLIKMESLITMSESERINEINSIFNDSKRSENSIILIDDIERIIEYVDIGPRFSNQLLQCMLVMINMATENNLTIVVTSSLDIRIIDALGFCFDDAFEIPLPTTREDKHEIVSITKTNLVMDDDLPIPIKRFYS